MQSFLVIGVSMNLLFVDFDNVLFVPEFKGKGVGMLQDEWIAWCVRYGNSSYKDSRPVSFMKEYLESRKNMSKMYVLTAVASSYEANVKRFMCNKYYEDLFSEFIAVGNSEDKLKIIKYLSEKEHCSFNKCELIEDDYTLLLKANEMGIICTHIAKVASIMYNLKK